MLDLAHYNSKRMILPSCPPINELDNVTWPEHVYLKLRYVQYVQHNLILRYVLRLSNLFSCLFLNITARNLAEILEIM